jgi:uncharacterized cupredoxin-like copper-binding protein
VKRSLTILATIFTFATTACGGGHDSHAEGSAIRTVDVAMEDIAFQPAAVTAQKGERVRFVFHNEGQIPHDAFIGDAGAQADHEREMRQGDGGHGMHMGGDAITVDPGKTGSLTHTFDRPGAIEIACHQSGHYAAGMKLTVTIT